MDGKSPGSGLLALIVIFFGLWLRGGSFILLQTLLNFAIMTPSGRLFVQARHHLIALVLWVIPLAAAEWWLFTLRRFAPQFGVWWWQKVPALRFGSPRAVYHAADVVLLILMALLIAVWIPATTTVAASRIQRQHRRRAFRVLRRGKYWLWFAALVIVGVYLPYRIVWSIPDT